MAKDSEATLLLRIKATGQEVLGKLRDSFDELKNIGIAAFAAITAVVIAAVKSYRDSEKAVNELNQAMVNQGIFTAKLSQQYQDIAANLQDVTTFADEAIVSAQAQIQAYIGQTQVTERLTRAILDFATAQGIDANRAADLIGKTIGTSTNALSRYGIQVDATASRSERMAQVLQQLERRYQGQAEAAAQGLGVLQQLWNIVDDLNEALGERLAPVIAVVATAIKNFAKDTQNSSALIDGFAYIFAQLIKLADTALLAFRNLGTSIGGFLGTTAGALSQAINGDFKQAWTTWVEGEKATTAEVEANRKAHAERMQAIDNALLQRKVDTAQKEADLERQSAENAAAVREEMSIQDAIVREQRMLEQMAYENSLIGMNQEQEIAAQISHLERKIQNEQNAQNKLTMIRQQAELLRHQKTILMQKAEQDLAMKHAQAQANIFTGAMNLIAATADTGSKAAFLAQKAAAIASTIVATNQAAALALASPPGPPATIPHATMAKVAGGLNLAAILATTVKGLAEGGIVRARPGGMPAIIGEGGKDEAVIPLDSPEASERLGGGGGMTIVFNGPILGDASQARELARAIDRELYNMRRDGESVAFDARIS